MKIKVLNSYLPFTSMQKILLFFLLNLCYFNVFSQDSLKISIKNQQENQSKISKKHFHLALAGASVAYGAGLYGLHTLWYKNNAQTSFRFFNDNQEWLQMDKLGHFFTTFQLSRLGRDALQKSPLSEKKALFYGSFVGAFLLTPIEIFDGFSAGYGASWGDEIANLSGSAMVLGQYLLWNELRIKPKFSFHTTDFASLRPNTLGKNFTEQLLKDYNGQTYWLSVDMDKFLPHKKFPKWLNIAVGYGAENMVFGRNQENLMAGFEQYRQFFLAPDLDLSFLKPKKRWAKIALYVLESIHLPSPALEYTSKGNLNWHWLYF